MRKKKERTAIQIVAKFKLERFHCTGIFTVKGPHILAKAWFNKPAHHVVETSHTHLNLNTDEHTSSFSSNWKYLLGKNTDKHASHDGIKYCYDFSN
jgi:hypothetical protein